MQEKKSPVKILYVNGNAMDRGGIEAFLMNYYRNMDPTKVHCDFIVHGDKVGVYNEEIENSGGRIYHVPIKSRHPLRYQQELRNIFSSGEYQIVHAHLDAMSCWVLKIASECGIKVRIAHSHNTKHLTNNPLKLLICELARKRLPRYATHYYACSEAAGRWMFGTSWGDWNSRVIHNAIELSLYRFNPVARTELRRKYQVEDDFVIGHVGRFSYQKNHEFLLDMFAELRKLHRKVKLVLIGDGENRSKIEKQIAKLKLEDAVLLLGSRSDVYDCYSMMDTFVLPSRFEGLGTVNIEAQVNGLTCFLADNITTEVCITDHVTMLSIESIDIWVNEISNYIKTYDGDRSKGESEINERMNSYNICMAKKKMENLYLSYV